MTTPRAVARVPAGEAVEVSISVNGTPTQLAVPARLTLADALRDHLGLTGTHLGCEHGVCGMCTVLVDGQAARACLLFACQLDGSEVVTVEGLGRPDALHPLQEAFGRHHALQCGFCTAGFLLSTYDLLDHRPDVPREELPQELSGVLCRCTGYRNIVDAVADVAVTHPDGIPGPGNSSVRPLVGRAIAHHGPHAVGTEEPYGEQGSASAERVGPGDVGGIRLPEGEPTVHVDVTKDLAAAVADVGRLLGDVPVLASCLPGAELTEALGDGWYRGRANVAFGPIRLSFASLAHVVEHDRSYIRVLAQGVDPGSGSAVADIRLRVLPATSGSGGRLHADARVFLAGRIAQFGRSLAGDVSRQMFGQFGSSVDRLATSGETGPRDARSEARAGGLRLLAPIVAARVRGTVRRLGRRRSSLK
ncbi:MAG: 2Fe-2S iron-sulfur cluster-binding protein [Nocardioidaceae bacterium]